MIQMQVVRLGWSEIKNLLHFEHHSKETQLLLLYNLFIASCTRDGRQRW